MIFCLCLTIDQNCQNIVIEIFFYNFLLSTIFLLAKIVKIWSWKINFYVYGLCGQKSSIYGQNIWNFLFYVVQNFVARWYYETLKQAYDEEIKKENI